MNKAALKAVLGRRDWFAQLDSEFADDILELGRIRRLNDSLIYSASDVADGMFALISGQVRMTKVFRSGQLVHRFLESTHIIWPRQFSTSMCERRGGG
jgi:CRP/FNR family transcriptional regulator, cyclic AMP receptor protein